MRRKTKVNIREIVLSELSRERLAKIPDEMNGDKAYAIESGNWWLPSDTHEYVDLRDMMVISLHEFFGIPNDVPIEILSFKSDILSFEKGVYPECGEIKNAH
jgi:hypothetical protein